MQNECGAKVCSITRVILYFPEQLVCIGDGPVQCNAAHGAFNLITECLKFKSFFWRIFWILKKVVAKNIEFME